MQAAKINVIVLGANGQLGFDLITVLHQFQVVGLTRKNILIDVATSLASISQCILPHLVNGSTNYIINCIALTNVDGCENDSAAALLINANFAYQLACICKQYDITLFQISTDYVFDGLKSTAYTEQSQPTPINLYGLSKYAGELSVSLYHNKYFIFRVAGLFGIAGASGKGGNFITTMRKLAATKDNISVIVDQISCPTSTLSIARAIEQFISIGVTDYGIYNCVSKNHCSWFEFAQEIFKLSHLDINKILPAPFAGYTFKAKRPQFTILDTKKISYYYTMPTWQESLAEYLTLYTLRL